MADAQPEPGWYRSEGDPPDTHRYWDGTAWVGEAQPLPAGSRSLVGHTLASPWERVLARVVDLVLLLGAATLVRALVDDDVGASQPSAAAAIITLMITVAYEVGMVSGLGATVGKLVAGVRIVDDHGAWPPNGVVAIRRWAPNVLVLVPFVGVIAAMAVLLASLIWIFTDIERRSIFDKAADTRVVSVRNADSRAGTA